MAVNIPKPIFVLNDVYSNSYTTALNVVKHLSPSNIECESNHDSHEAVLLCGTNDGTINLWSLSNYRLCNQISSTDVSKLTELDQNDVLRFNSIFAISNSKLICQLNTKLLFGFKLPSSTQDSNSAHSVSLTCKWQSFPTTFAKCFHLLGNCFAFLSPSNSDVIQLANLEHNVTIGAVKLGLVKTTNTNTPESKTNHGMVMSIHLFVIDTVVPLEASRNEQTLYVLVSYESGLVSLFRASLKTTLEAICTQTKPSARLWQTEQLSSLQSHPEMITCGDFNQNTMRGVTCSVDNEIALWCVNLPEKVIPRHNNDDVQATPPVNHIDQLVKSGQVGIHEHKSKRIRVTNAGILCCAIRPDGRIFATGGKDGRIRVFALKSGKPLAILPFHTKAIECVHFSVNLAVRDPSKPTSPSFRYLLCASARDKLISIWSLYNDPQ